MEGQSTEFSPWLARWGLEPDGPAFQTTSTRSLLLPVRQGATRAMLKIATERTEIAGGAVMAWWDGAGAAPVLAWEGPALLMLRADGGDLTAMAREGDDEAATAIACQAVAGLHRPRESAPPATVESTQTWFRGLRAAAATDSLFGRACTLLDSLLAEGRPHTVLHGDIHHGNVLDFGANGWLAIDPKGVFGERTYEYANLIRNPDPATVMRRGRTQRQLAQIATLAGLDPDRLARWTLVHAALSAAWCIEDGVEVEASLELLRYLWAELSIAKTEG